MMADKVGLFLRVDPDFKAALEAAAAADERSVSSLIVRTMKEWMAENASASTPATAVAARTASPRKRAVPAQSKRPAAPPL